VETPACEREEGWERKRKRTDGQIRLQTESHPWTARQSGGMNERSAGMNERTAGWQRDHGEGARRRGCCLLPPLRASQAIFKPGKGSDAQAERVKKQPLGKESWRC